MVIDTFNEAWRHECEVRYVLHLSSLDARRAYLQDVEIKRGKASADQLRADVMNAWRDRNPAPLANG
jgi:hypothetical protein